VAVDRRLARLRALVLRLERMPASTDRDWMLTEARARMADVETGDVPRALRPRDPDEEARLAHSMEGPPPMRRPRPRPVPKRIAPPPPRVPAPPEVPRPPDRPPADAEVFVTDDVFWLDEPGADEPGDQEQPRWRRGLHG
jgi:hypothetical protein